MRHIVDRDPDLTPILRTAAERRRRVIRDPITLRTPRITPRIQPPRQFRKSIQFKTATQLRRIPRHIHLQQRIRVNTIATQHTRRRHTPRTIRLHHRRVTLRIQRQRHTRSSLTRAAERRLPHVRQIVRITEPTITRRIQPTRKRRRRRHVNLNHTRRRRLVPRNVHRSRRITVMPLRQRLGHRHTPVPIRLNRRFILQRDTIRIHQLQHHHRTRFRRAHKHRVHLVRNPIIVEKTTIRTRTHPRRDKRLRIQRQTPTLHRRRITRSIRRIKTVTLQTIPTERIHRNRPVPLLVNHRRMLLTRNLKRHTRTRFTRTHKPWRRHIRDPVNITHTTVTRRIQPPRYRRRRHINRNPVTEGRHVPRTVRRRQRVNMLTLAQTLRHLRRPVTRRIHNRHIVLTRNRKNHRSTHFRRPVERRLHHVRVVVVVRKSTVRTRRQTTRHKRLRINRKRPRQWRSLIPRRIQRNR